MIYYGPLGVNTELLIRLISLDWVIRSQGEAGYSWFVSTVRLLHLKY